MKKGDDSGDDDRKLPAVAACDLLHSSSASSISEAEGKGTAIKAAATSKKPAKVAAATKKKHGPRKAKRKKPKNAPQRALSAYNVFFRDERARILQARSEGNPGEIGAARAADLFSAMGKAIAKRWKELSPEELVVYTEAAGEDMKRYRKEMALYRTSLAATQNVAEEKEGPEYPAGERGRVQQPPSEFKDMEDAAVPVAPSRYPEDSEEEASHLAIMQQLATAREASLSAMNAATAMAQQHQRQQHILGLLRGQEQMRYTDESGNIPSTVQGHHLGSLAQLTSFLTPQERLASSFQPSPQDAFENQQHQRLQFMESHYVRAALEQERNNMAAAALTRELQLHQLQQQELLQHQQMRHDLASALRLTAPFASLRPRDPPPPPFSGLQEADLPAGSVSTALIQMLLQEQRQQAEAASGMAQYQQQQQRQESDGEECDDDEE